MSGIGWRSVFGVVLGIVLAACSRDDNSLDTRTGQQYFQGDLALQGSLQGHDTLLPAAALKCINCHAAEASQQTGKVGFAPILTRAHLIEPKSRRGGPASAFDQASFCRVLREGIDPAMVMIDTAMPRYRLTDAQCAALWQYLSNKLQ